MRIRFAKKILGQIHYIKARVFSKFADAITEFISEMNNLIKQKKSESMSIIDMINTSRSKVYNKFKNKKIDIEAEIEIQCLNTFYVDVNALKTIKAL